MGIHLQAAGMSATKKPNRRNPKPGVSREKFVPLLIEIEDALGTARAFGRALELMSFGFQELKDDYGTALMTVTASVLRQVDNARDTCAKLRAETDA